MCVCEREWEREGITEVSSLYPTDLQESSGGRQFLCQAWPALLQELCLAHQPFPAIYDYQSLHS